MDLQVIKKQSILYAIWLSLFLSVILVNSLSSSWIVWAIYALAIGLIFLAAKLWNKTLSEPLLDVNLTYLEMSISVILAMMVSLFGGALFRQVLEGGTFSTLLMALVMAESQFTLLKSVQPDPASPTHGFNRVVSLSRPIYFCLLATILLACGSAKNSSDSTDEIDKRPSLVFYSFDILDRNVIALIGKVSLILILSFPIIFWFGLLPQITTFMIYILEQIDMHFFGSTAATLGIKSAVYSFSRSLLAVALLYLIALQSIGNQKLFSLFCGLLVSIAYFLSRNSSDTTIAYRIIKRILKALNPVKITGESEKLELQDLGMPSSSQVLPTNTTAEESTASNSQGSTKQLQQVQQQSQEPVQQLTAASSSPTSSTSSSSSTSIHNDDDSTIVINSRDTTVAGTTTNTTTNNINNTTTTTTTTNSSNDDSIEDAITESRVSDVGVHENRESNNGEQDEADKESEERDSDTDSISTRIQRSIDDICIRRIKKDLVRCLCMTIIVFALHITTVFNQFHDQIEKYIGFLAVVWGFLFHFVIPQLRRELPCMCLAKPVLRPREYNFFEVKTHAKVMWFEKLHYAASLIEKNFLYPLFWLNTITHDSTTIKDFYGSYAGPLILVIISLKLVRSSFNDPSPNYITIIFTYLFFNYDVAKQNYSIATLNYFVFSILHLKIHELLLKLQFIYIYIAPWQIAWGSAFHAFAQPFFVPHSTLLFCQAILSSIISAPLQPILGSAIFMMSYVRPVKFWERDYNTNVIDINSTRLVTQLERSRIDSNRLDGIFYEHLTKCLQRKLCRDLSLGRWGLVSQGDCFIMASDNLNCLVHIIELGNGVCTFQLRGLEFKGTYCQQQEVEAITEGVSHDDGFCCCEIGSLPYFLSANAAFNQLWLAWHVTHARYVLEGYSISDNLAGPMLQPFDLRRALITYYVKAIIYFTVTSTHLSKWLKTKEFHQALEHTKERTYADLDPTFSLSLDLDFDMGLCGVTRSKFCSVYFDWIKYCVDRVKTDRNDVARAKSIADLDCNPDSFLITLCYGLSLLARRSLSAISDGQQFHTVESLLFGLHALLKGDFRITSLHDEWVFQEMRLFKLVVIPAVRMSLKLYQDHFATPEDYEDNMALYEAIAGYQKNLVISHETDVAWREAVLSGVPSLLTLRLYNDDGSNQYRFIMLNRRYLSFRIIKINRECVRGLWASQQQELIFFRNTDPERGSIQNARQALRNMINSSCDQPVGYPIYVSPLTTSYVESGTMSSFVN